LHANVVPRIKDENNNTVNKCSRTIMTLFRVESSGVDFMIRGFNINALYTLLNALYTLPYG